MFGQARLNELRSRRELLLAQADAHRQLITLDVQNVVHSLRWVDSFQRIWQQLKPLASLAAPVAGFYGARKGRSLWRWAVLLFEAGRRVRRILSE
jgi:hypothetical protein